MVGSNSVETPDGMSDYFQMTSMTRHQVVTHLALYKLLFSTDISCTQFVHASWERLKTKSWRNTDMTSVNGQDRLPWSLSDLLYNTQLLGKTLTPNQIVFWSQQSAWCCTNRVSLYLAKRTQSTPPIFPSISTSDGFPNGVVTDVSFRFSKMSGSSSPVPPIIPIYEQNSFHTLNRYLADMPFLCVMTAEETENV